MEERDILVFTDEEGQEIQMEVLDYFEYDEEEYAMLVEAGEEDEEHHHHHDHEDGTCCHDEEQNIYLMKVITDGETEEFVPVDEEKMDDLIAVVQELYDEDDFEDDNEE